MAYLIKGFILTLKKNYENISKDISYFLELKFSTQNESKIENPEKKLQKKPISLTKFGIIPDSSIIDMSLNFNSSSVARQFISSVKKDSKKPSSVKKMMINEDSRKLNLSQLVNEYSDKSNSKGHLFDNIFKNDEIYNPSMNANVFDESQNNFSNYINVNFDNEEFLNNQENQKIEFLNTENRKRESISKSNIIIANFDKTFDKKDEEILKNLGKNKELNSKKIINFKTDEKTNLSPNELIQYFIKEEEILMDPFISKLDDEHKDQKILVKNCKTLFDKQDLTNFIESIRNERLNKIINKIDNIIEKPITNSNLIDSVNKSNFNEENFRTEKRFVNSFESSIHMSNLTINDVFGDKYLLNNLSNNKNKIDEEQNIIVEEDSNLNTFTYNYKKNFQNFKSEIELNENFFNEVENPDTKSNYEIIQEEIESELKLNKNNDIHLLKLLKNINHKTSIEISKSERESISVIFYNLLLLGEKGTNLVQNNSFGKVQIMKLK